MDSQSRKYKVPAETATVTINESQSSGTEKARQSEGWTLRP